MKNLKIIILLVFVCFLITANVYAKTAKEAIETSFKWLKANQKEDGSFSSYPAITALVCSGFLRAGYTESDETVKKGINYILKCVKDDGSIYSNDKPNYNTAICIITLSDTRNPKYADIIKKGRKWLENAQVGSDGKAESSDIFYGGIGYDSHMKADMSNLQHALEAIKITESYASEEGKVIDAGPLLHHEHKDDVFSRAIVFLQRCQNLKSANDQAWAGDDGGFVYTPDGESKSGGNISFGSQTYAGLKSLLYCDLTKGDPRIIAAYNWIKKNFTVDENPFMGQQGLFYYFHTMSKALLVYGEKEIVDAKNVKHEWAKEVSNKIISLQDKDGFWINPNKRFWEDNKDLVTAYSILSLQFCMNNL